MKDLSKLDLSKSFKDHFQSESEKPEADDKKKKLMVVAIVALLSIAATSKLINNYLKKVKAKEKVQIQQVEKSSNEANSNEKSDFLEKIQNDKMVFTFYDKLKQNSVVLDMQPQAQKTQQKYTYIYQIASFRSLDEASWYVKKLKGSGLNPKFKHFDNWIRMYLGPYNTRRAMAGDIIKLQKLGINGGFARKITSS